MSNFSYKKSMVYTLIVLLLGISFIPIIHGTIDSIVLADENSNWNMCITKENDKNSISFFSNYQDTNPPNVTINFAGNPFDKGGPYWAYITTPNGQLEEGVQASKGYYTN